MRLNSKPALLKPQPLVDERIEDVYVVTPLQEGMLFYSLNAPNSGAYINQQSYALEGEVDASAFRQSFEQVIGRHQILRTGFVTDEQGKPRQMVLRRVALPWQEYDWSDLSRADQEQRLEELLQRGRHRDFDLSSPPLVEATFIKCGPDRYQFIWRYHLTLLDGWSVAVVLAEVIAIYGALARGQALRLKQPLPFRRYIDWLERQDRVRGREYWRKTLQGFVAPTSIGEDQVVPATPTEDVYRQQEVSLQEGETAALKAFARKHRVTTHTVILGAWALHLAQQSGVDDVVFGNVVAGRPVELPGMESMVGLFINNLPVRARIEMDAPVVPWLQELQVQQAEARRYEYMSLPDIQQSSEVPRGTPLFSSVVVFQNYPVNAALASMGSPRIVAASSIERNSYPLMLVIEPGPRLLLRSVYDSRVFEAATVSRLIQRFRDVIASVLADEKQTIVAVRRGAIRASRELRASQ